MRSISLPASADALRTGQLSRRQVMRAFGASALLVGCGEDDVGTAGTGAGGAPTTNGSTTASAGGGGGLGQGGAGGGDPFAQCKQRGPTEGCFVTEDNILGPYYKAGAPFDPNLADDLEGELLLIEGTVYGCDCETPLAGAIVDVWQADSDGAYDNTGFLLRGKVQTDADGRYSFLTIKPGWYLNGSQYRPAHIHYKVSHQDGVALTTQLYFEGDPYIPIDPFVKESLVIPLSAGNTGRGRGLVGTFDVVLG
ncbi:MAG: hypothetical protein JNL21_31300 [Myxococcales bacterium]|nr:hypothetical protein [Myxococcales bacterium]